MTNSEVFTAFALGANGTGGSVKSVTIGDGVTVLYSYSTPIALSVPGEVPFFDARKYSVTTSKQANQARRACFSHRDLSHDEFRAQCKAWGVWTGGAR